MHFDRYQHAGAWSHDEKLAPGTGFLKISDADSIARDTLERKLNILEVLDRFWYDETPQMLPVGTQGLNSVIQCPAAEV